MNASLVLKLALALMGVGMALVFVGVISPSLFYPGAVLIGIGLLGVAVAGVLGMFLRSDAA